MGNDVVGKLRVAGKSSEGRALFETDEIIFRGASHRLRIPLAAIEKATAEKGELTLVYGKETATLVIGEHAEKWAHKIANPKSLLDKLGVDPKMRVAVIAVDDDAFVDQLRAKVSDLSIGKAKKESHLIFYGAEAKKDLSKLATLKGSLDPAGALWVIRPKGVDAITEKDVMAAGKAAGLVDVKVARFSATHTAEKFVIPVAKRR